MAEILFAWIGRTDLQASRGVDSAGDGPIAQALAERTFAQAALISDWPPVDGLGYTDWLRKRTRAPIELFECKLRNGPMDFGAIYEAAKSVVMGVLARDRSATPVFHLSPGSPAMAAVWILLGKSLYPAELVESSREHGLQTARIPFDISADFIPDVLRQQDEALERRTAGVAPTNPGFDDIVHRSPAMARAISMARRVAPRSITILLEGESGTGKELLARAVHRASPRHQGPFVTVNCGAIPRELAESELFGHRRGAFTGAIADRRGHFEQANGGTILLDEVGELPRELQVKLLRVLQQREVTPIGESKARPLDVRVIAATNRSLVREVSEGRFREDLFYRLAVAVIALPALRDRVGDVGLLTEHALAQINTDSAEERGFEAKTLSAAARNLLLRHEWPGNVRELQNTLRRAVLWSDRPVLSPEDVRAALLAGPVRGTAGGVLDLPIGRGFEVEAIMSRVARHYLERALLESGANKSRAAELLGLGSYQTFTNWMKRYGVVS